MNLLEIVLILTALLCALIAGFVFAFATVVMPGLARLGDRGFIRGFQAIDGVIQAGQPIFGLVWVGSLVAVVITAVLAVLQQSPVQGLVVCSTLAYVFGVQVPTFRINVPMNNALQALDTDAMDDAALAAARQDFEPLWVRWNTIRTVIANLVCVALMTALLWV